MKYFLVCLASGFISAPAFAVSECDAELMTPRVLAQKLLQPGELTVSLMRGVYASASARLEAEVSNLIAQATTSQPTYKSLIEPLDRARAAFIRMTSPLQTLGNISVDVAVRDETEAVLVERQSLLTRLIYGNLELYQLVRLVSVQGELQERMLASYLEVFSGSGLGHPDGSVRAKIANNDELISSADSQFVRQLSKAVPAVELLDGSAFDPRSKSDLIQVLTNTAAPAVRKQAYLAARSRAPDNVKHMRTSLILRDEIAKHLHGKSATWVDVELDHNTLVGSPAKAKELLGLLAKGYQDSVRDVLEEMAHLKRQEEGTVEGIRPWDIHYYDKKRKTALAANDGGDPRVSVEALMHHMPKAETLKKAISRLGDAVGIRFELAADNGLYAKGVRLFSAFDKATGRNLGQLIVDGMVRDGKNPSSNYITNYLPSFKDEAGIVLMHVNFEKEVEAAGSTFTFDELRTLVHEMGHAVHYLLAKTPELAIAGVQRSSDMMEIPSIFFEQLLLEPEFFLSLLTPTDGKSPTLEEVRAAIVATRKAENMGYLKPAPFLSTTYQQNGVFLAILDLMLHGMSADQLRDLDFTKFYREQFAVFHGYETDVQDSMLSQFFHSAVGMNGTYHAYCISRLYVRLLQDWFEQNGGLMNSNAMMRYRRAILEPSLIERPVDMLGALIGPKPDLTRAIEKIFQ